MQTLHGQHKTSIYLKTSEQTFLKRKKYILLNKQKHHIKNGYTKIIFSIILNAIFVANTTGQNMLFNNKSKSFFLKSIIEKKAHFIKKMKGFDWKKKKKRFLKLSKLMEVYND